MKRKRPSEAAVWKPVDVSLPEPEAKSRNHYDDDGGGGKRKTSRLVPNDLEGRPGEEMGFFFGLETIPADAYRVETKTDGTKRFQILSKDDKEKNNEEHGGEKAATKANTTSKKKQKSDDDGKVNPSKKVKTKKQKEKAAKQQTTEKSTSKEGKTTSSKKDDDEHSTSVVVSDDQITSLQLAWSSATGGVVLHKHLCACLASQSFFTPTPIQAAALAPAILGRRNIVGSAPTGSGKTLAFLLPICQDLLERRDENDNDNDTFLRSLPLQALILTPTRELALQIHKECHRLLPGSIGTLVGGLAHAKQVRVLQQQRPPILVATPGRLWELVGTSLPVCEDV